MNQLNAIKVFKRVVELNSFSAAARALRMSNAAVSKSVSDLENHLGTQLLVRTTRRISVTEAGENYFQRCTSILQDLEEADLSASSNSREPRGRLKINAPMSFGLLRIAPLISDFLSLHQEIEIDLVLNDSVVDLIQSGFDVGLRIGGNQPDSSLVSKRLMPIDRLVCGSYDYFEKFGYPNTPTDLYKHRCLIYSLSSSPSNWLFTKQGRVESIQVTGPLIVNNSIALRETLLGGIGLSLIPKFIVENELADGTLVQTLHDYQPDPQSLHVVYPQAKYVSQKVRAFVDFMSDSFSGTLSAKR